MTNRLVLKELSGRYRFTVSPERPVVIGRTEDNDFSIPELTVSRHHVRISFADGQWLVEDAGSRGGTYLNGKPVREPAVIGDSDVIELSAVVKLRVGSAPPE